MLLAVLLVTGCSQDTDTRVFRVPSSSMEPTLRSGDRVLVARFIYRLHDPRRGDIIVFHPPGHGDTAPS